MLFILFKNLIFKVNIERIQKNKKNKNLGIGLKFYRYQRVPIPTPIPLVSVFYRYHRYRYQQPYYLQSTDSLRDLCCDLLSTAEDLLNVTMMYIFNLSLCNFFNTFIVFIKAVGIGIGGIGKILIPVVSVSVSVHVGIGKISNRYQDFFIFYFFEFFQY